MKKRTYKRKKKDLRNNNNSSSFFDLRSIRGFLAGILFTLLVTSLPRHIAINSITLYYKTFFAPVAFASSDKKFLTEIGSPLVVDGENFPQQPQKQNNQDAGQVILHGPRDKKEVALTFDADMTPWMEDNLKAGGVQSYYDSALVDLLNQTQTEATMFLTGLWIESYPNVTKQLAQNPLFELANHSYSHPSFSGDCYGLPHVSSSDYPIQVEQTQKLLKTVAGVTNQYFRFPGGCYSEDNLAMLRKMGLTVVHWDVVADDGFNSNTQQIENNVLEHVQNGSIIVMHFNGPPNEPSTKDALQIIIPALKKRGFQFVKVSELLNPQEVSVADIKKYLLSFEEKTGIK